MNAHRVVGSLQPVVGEQIEGSRHFVKLACGHRKIRNPRAPMPKRAYCFVCEAK